jgi:hypothetical protein
MHIRRAPALVAAVLSSTTILTGQTQPTTLTGHVSISTSTTGRTTVVAVKKDAKGNADAMFCVSHPKPVAEKVAYEGPGKVTYRPQPIPGLPTGVKISGPEAIAPVLAVVASDGKAMLFVAEGQTAPLAAADPSLKTAKTFKVAIVVRQDWDGPNGLRRGIDVQSCLAPAG